MPTKREKNRISSLRVRGERRREVDLIPRKPNRMPAVIEAIVRGRFTRVRSVMEQPTIEAVRKMVGKVGSVYSQTWRNQKFRKVRRSGESSSSSEASETSGAESIAPPMMGTRPIMAGMRATVTRASRKICRSAAMARVMDPFSFMMALKRRINCRLTMSLRFSGSRRAFRMLPPMPAGERRNKNPRTTALTSKVRLRAHFQPDQEDDPGEDEKDFQKIRHKKKT